jgi:hypothetical protein
MRSGRGGLGSPARMEMAPFLASAMFRGKIVPCIITASSRAGWAAI